MISALLGCHAAYIGIVRVTDVSGSHATYIGIIRIIDVSGCHATYIGIELPTFRDVMQRKLV